MVVGLTHYPAAGNGPTTVLVGSTSGAANWHNSEF
jgi:hypothetical protein